MRRLGVLLGTVVVAVAASGASGATALSVHGSAKYGPSIHFGNSCLPARIMIRGYGSRLILRTDSACGAKDEWHEMGHIPGIHPSLYEAEDGTIGLNTWQEDNTRLIYFIRAWSGHRHIERYLVMVDTTRPAEFIYEGTDGFVNYCINRSRRIESLDHRLFCVRPGYSDEWAYVTRRDPR